jgi:hypothetical protein
MGYANAVGKKAVKVDGKTIYIHRENDQSNRELGPKKALVYHWTAGTYEQCFDAYHFNIIYDKAANKAHAVKNLNTNQLGQHLWGRNTGMLAISFSAMRGAVNTTNHQGLYPITDEMISVGAQLGAELCAWYFINPREFLTLPKKQIQGNNLVTVSGIIKVPTITDHATIAKFDSYSESRWDVGTYMVKVKEQLLTHYDKLKADKAKFQYLGIIKD